MTAGSPAGGMGRRIYRPQRDAANPVHSVWVAASAGTGKTKVLTDRVLRLLLGGTPPDKLLCLTFTRAAAAEMANRVNGELGRWVLLDDDALDTALEALAGAPADSEQRGRARRLFAAVLDAPGGLKIMTIHAFCQSLLGRFPIEARLAPHFEVLDERSAAELMLAAQDSVLRRAREGGDPALRDALAEVSGHTSEDTFRELMGKLRGERGRLHALIARHRGLDSLIANTCSLLGVADDDTAERIVAHACADDAADSDSLAAACEALAQGSATDAERGVRIARWLAADTNGRRNGFNDYMRVFIKQDGEPYTERNLITKAAQKHDAAAIDHLRGEQQRLVGVVEQRKAVVVARATAALLRLGGAMLDDYDRHKTVRARLDYDDLILRSVGLLERPGVAPWVLYKLDGGLDHILVDEAQDTSPVQWRVIAALAEEFFAGLGAHEGERTLFTVGDEKQSIFSFQGADLRALDAMRTHFKDKVEAAEKTWTEVGLDLSFRSTAEVLRAVDAVFAQPSARDGVAFADHAIAHRPERKGHAGLVELWPIVKAIESGPQEPWTPPVTRKASDRPSARLASTIAGTIMRWIGDEEPLASRGRPIVPGDVLVLVRRRTAFVGELVRALKQAEVPVAGADRMVLGEQLAVMDLVALASFLLLPDDDLTLACVLRGPLIGLGEEALFDLAYKRRGSLWRELTRRRDARDDFAGAHAELAALLSRVDFRPPYELFADVLGARGGRRKLVARLGVDANDPIDEFLRLALDYERAGPPSLQGFLHWLAAGDTQIKRDLEQGRNEVRVMTVHGAKGLEAPIVILPDTATVPGNHGMPLLWHEGADGDEALLWPVRRDYHEARSRAARAAMRSREMQEYRRLLYVAMTRAEDRLYICGWGGKREMPADCWYRLVEAGLADVAEPFTFDGTSAMTGGWAGPGLRLTGRQTRNPETDAPARRPTVRPAAPPDFAQTPPPPEPAPPRPLTPSRPAAAEPAVLSPLAGGVGDARFHRGRLIHQLLQILPEVAPEERGAVCRRVLARPAHGLDGDAQAGIAAEVLAVLADSRFAPLFGPSSRAEVPLVGVVDGTVVAGQVDRLLVGDERVLVIDFKTNRPAPEREEDVPPAYRDQMAAYRAVLSRIYPGRPIDCALLWTDGPRLMQLILD